MRSEAMKSKMLYDRPLPTQRIVNAIADSKFLCKEKEREKIFNCVIHLEAQVNTQQYGRRPYGVGLLVIGHDVSEDPLQVNEAHSISLGNWPSLV